MMKLSKSVGRMQQRLDAKGLTIDDLLANKTLWEQFNREEKMGREGNGTAELDRNEVETFLSSVLPIPEVPLPESNGFITSEGGSENDVSYSTTSTSSSSSNTTATIDKLVESENQNGTCLWVPSGKSANTTVETESSSDRVDFLQSEESVVRMSQQPENSTTTCAADYSNSNHSHNNSTTTCAAHYSTRGVSEIESADSDSATEKNSSSDSDCASEGKCSGDTLDQISTLSKIYPDSDQASDKAAGDEEVRRRSESATYRRFQQRSLGLEFPPSADLDHLQVIEEQTVERTVRTNNFVERNFQDVNNDDNIGPSQSSTWTATTTELRDAHFVSDEPEEPVSALLRREEKVPENDHSDGLYFASPESLGDFILLEGGLFSLPPLADKVESTHNDNNNMINSDNNSDTDSSRANFNRFNNSLLTYRIKMRKQIQKTVDDSVKAFGECISYWWNVIIETISVFWNYSCDLIVGFCHGMHDEVSKVYNEFLYPVVWREYVREKFLIGTILRTKENREYYEVYVEKRVSVIYEALKQALYQLYEVEFKGKMLYPFLKHGNWVGKRLVKKVNSYFHNGDRNSSNPRISGNSSINPNNKSTLSSSNDVSTFHPSRIRNVLQRWSRNIADFGKDYFGMERLEFRHLIARICISLGLAMIVSVFPRSAHLDAFC